MRTIKRSQPSSKSKPLALASCVLLTLITGMLITACVDSELRTTTGQSYTNVELNREVYVPPAGTGSIQYMLTWEMGQAQFSADGKSWSAETPLGYTVTLLDGWLTNATLQLVDCVELESASARFPWVNALSAGHGDEVDPTLSSGPFIDSLIDPQPLNAGTISQLGASYCQGHYVVAGQSAADLSSITLLGEWKHAKTGETGTFEIDSSLAWGQVHDLPSVIDFANGQTVHVSVSRQLGSIFDTADFLTMSDSEVDRAILRQLTEQSQFNVSIVE